MGKATKNPVKMAKKSVKASAKVQVVTSKYPIREDSKKPPGTYVDGKRYAGWSDASKEKQKLSQRNRRTKEGFQAVTESMEWQQDEVTFLQDALSGVFDYICTYGDKKQLVNSVMSHLEGKIPFDSKGEAPPFVKKTLGDNFTLTLQLNEAAVKGRKWNKPKVPAKKKVADDDDDRLEDITFLVPDADDSSDDATKKSPPAASLPHGMSLGMALDNRVETGNNKTCLKKSQSNSTDSGDNDSSGGSLFSDMDETK